MSLEQTAFLAEIIGGAALVISVIYLAFEVRSNTNVVKANAGWETQRQWSAFSLMMSQHPMCAEFARSFEPGVSFADFEEDDRLKIGFLARGVMQQFEAEMFQHQAGILDTKIWSTQRNTIANLLRLPFWKVWWENERTQGLYTKEFMESLEAFEPMPVRFGKLAGDN